MLTLAQKVLMAARENEAEELMAEVWERLHARSGCVDLACAFAVAHLALELARADQGRYPYGTWEPEPGPLLPLKPAP